MIVAWNHKPPETSEAFVDQVPNDESKVTLAMGTFGILISATWISSNPTKNADFIEVWRLHRSEGDPDGGGEVEVADVFRHSIERDGLVLGNVERSCLQLGVACLDECFYSQSVSLPAHPPHLLGGLNGKSGDGLADIVW